jgi:hypothetical protein
MFIRPFIFAASILAGASAIAACDDSTAAPHVPPPPAASVSLDWTQRTGTLVASGRLSPLAAGRVYAAVTVAQYRAAKAAGLGPVQGGATYDARLGAVAAASVQVLSFLFPTAADSLGRMLAAQAAAGSGDKQAEFARGVALGRAAGDVMIDRLKNDGFTRAWTGTAQTGSGIWVPVTLPPAGGTLGSVTPYLLQSGSQFRPAAPPAFGSAAFNTDLNEVVQFSKNRTPAQLDLAKSWDYSAGTTTAVGYWNKAAAEYVAAKQLDELSAARVFAVMHAAVFDAQIACWDAKYQYWMARPYEASSEISTALAPPNHPSFPSGHSCVSAAAARVLEEFFPDQAAHLNALVTDAGMSRIYAGIHYRFDINGGQQLGRAVASWAIAHSGSL